ncbi:MAG: hypothetical protein WCE44_14675 [Candidatus Velthaea sp.]
MKPKVFILSVVLGLGVLSSPALALLGPMPVIDMSAIGKLGAQISNQITQINHAYTQVQQGIQLVTSVKQNLSHISMTPSSIMGDISSLTADEKSVSAQIAAYRSAWSIAQQDQSDAAENAGFAAAAKAANGAQQQAEVLNNLELQQLDTQQKTLHLQAGRQIQDAANATDFATDLLTVTGNGSTSSANSGPDM